MNRRKNFALAVVIIGAAVLLIAVIHHYQLRAAVDAYRTELKAKGELLDVAQLLPPSIPPEENGVGILRKFSALMVSSNGLLTTNVCPAMKMVAPGKAMIGWQQPDVRDYDQTNSWDDFSNVLSENAKIFEMLQQIRVKPDFDFQAQYDQGLELSYPNFYMDETWAAIRW